MPTAPAIPACTSRPVLRYPGGKSRAIKVLDTLLPQGPVRTVLSPFLGGGSYELHLTGRGVTVTGYDGYAPLVNYWRHQLTDPDGLADAADALRPLDKAAFRRVQQHVVDHHVTVDDAAGYLAVNRSSFSGSTLSGGYSPSAARDRFNDALIGRVRAFTNPHLTVAVGQFEDTITGGYDLIFADPPYWLPGDGNHLYGSRGSMHAGFDHHVFREVLGAVDSPWLVTYNDAPQVRDLWAGYRLTPVAWAYGMNVSKKSSELVIRNY